MRNAGRWFLKKQPNLVVLLIGLVCSLALLSIGEASFALEDKGSHSRKATSLGLGASGDDRARTSLISALGERGPDTDLASTLDLQQLDAPLRKLILQTLTGSQQAMEKLIIRNDPLAHPPLVEALGNWNPAVRQAAAETLKTMGGKEVVDFLINALEELDPIIRWEAARILGAIGDARATVSLIQTLQDLDPDVREAAAWALGAIGDDRARDSLFSALSDKYSDVRKAATQALDRLEEPLGVWIHQTLTGFHQAMEKLVMRNDPRSYPPLVRALGDRDSAVRQAATRTLKMLGNKEVVDLLIKAMEDLNPILRRGAAWILLDIEDQRTADPMIQALGDGDPEVRTAAAWTLFKLGTHHAREPLIHALGDSEPGVRVAAAWGLVTVGDPRAVDPLIKAMGDRNSDVRKAAVSALGHVGDRRAVEPLLKVLGKGEAGIREAAAGALGRIGDRRAVEPLVDALGSRSSGVREAAAEALESFGEPLGRLIDETLNGSPEAIHDLVSRKDPRALDPLIQALWDNDSNVRRAAARSLGCINDARAVDGLLRMASSWNLLDRVVATTALVKIDQESFSDYVVVAFSVLTRPASVVYLLGVLLFVFVTHKTARWIIMIKAKSKKVDIFKPGPIGTRSMDLSQK